MRVAVDLADELPESNIQAGNLQPSSGCPTRRLQNLSGSLLNHLMNVDQASGPRMPRINNLVLRYPEGVLS